MGYLGVSMDLLCYIKRMAHSSDPVGSTNWWFDTMMIVVNLVNGLANMMFLANLVGNGNKSFKGMNMMILRNPMQLVLVLMSCSWALTT